MLSVMKGKFVPVDTSEVYGGGGVGVEVWLHSFLTAALDGDESSS